MPAVNTGIHCQLKVLTWLGLTNHTQINLKVAQGWAGPRPARHLLAPVVMMCVALLLLINGPHELEGSALGNTSEPHLTGRHCR